TNNIVNQISMVSGCIKNLSGKELSDNLMIVFNGIYMLLNQNNIDFGKTLSCGFNMCLLMEFANNNESLKDPFITEDYIKEYFINPISLIRKQDIILEDYTQKIFNLWNKDSLQGKQNMFISLYLYGLNAYIRYDSIADDFEKIVKKTNKNKIFIFFPKEPIFPPNGKFIDLFKKFSIDS
ncbi:MAG: hypothetical protein ACYCUW_09430, partial [bacterium]